MFAISVLRQLKRSRTFKELSARTHIPVPVLSRYVSGRVLPSNERSDTLIRDYKNVLVEEVRQVLRFNAHGHFDHLPLLFNTELLQHVAGMAASELAFLKPDKILTTSSDGLPISYLLGTELGIGVVYAKKKKEVGVEEFLEQRVVLKDSAYNYSVFIPSYSIKKGERVLIVDDAIRSTTTVKSLIDLCASAKAETVGVFSIISVGKNIDELSECYTFPVKSLVKF